jgi:nitrate/nitrite transport system substrate-binding protein
MIRIGGLRVAFCPTNRSAQQEIKMKSIRRQILLVAMCSFAVAACGSEPAPSETTSPSKAGSGSLEKPVLKLGFIKLTDMAPLAIAKEKGFFADEGLTVSLEPQANWKVLVDGVASGGLDGAHMLAGHPIASGAGIGAKVKIVTPLSMDMNGKAVTLSNKVYGLIAPTLPKGADGKHGFSCLWA